MDALAANKRKRAHVRVQERVFLKSDRMLDTTGNQRASTARHIRYAQRNATQRNAIGDMQNTSRHPYPYTPQAQGQTYNHTWLEQTYGAFE